MSVGISVVLYYSTYDLFLPKHIYILEDDSSIDTSDKDSKTSLDTKQLISLFHQKYPDTYDFIAVFPSFPPNKEFDTVANSYVIQNDARGICMEVSECFWYWEPCASKTLKALEVFTYKKNNYDELVKNPKELGETLLHEIGHTWGVELGNVTEEDGKLPEGINKSCTKRDIPISDKDTNHWSDGLEAPQGAYSAVKDPLPWVYQGDNIYTYDLSYYDLPVKFHPFDLYLMGLIDPSEIKQEFLLLTEKDYYFGTLPNGQEVKKSEIAMKAKAIKVNINDLIKIAGEERNPDSKNSQKDFKIAYVILIKKGQKPSKNMVKAIEKLSQIFPEQWSFATDNRATMNYNQ